MFVFALSIGIDFSNKMIKIAEIRKKNVSAEIERLSSMEDIKSRIMGISEEEVLNG